MYHRLVEDCLALDGTFHSVLLVIFGQIVQWVYNNLGQAGDSSYFRVEISAVWKLLHHNGAGVVQQGLLMNRVLHLRDFLQVIQLKAFSLKMHAET